jgi:hypothetical protein
VLSCPVFLLRLQCLLQRSSSAVASAHLSRPEYEHDDTTLNDRVWTVSERDPSLASDAVRCSNIGNHPVEHLADHTRMLGCFERAQGRVKRSSGCKV